MRLLLLLAVAALLVFPTPALAGADEAFGISPSSPQVGEAVTFTAEDCKDKRTYFWTFGEGPDGTGCVVVRTFSAAGTYTVRLVVTKRDDDDDDREERTRTITVRAAPAQPQPQPIPQPQPQPQPIPQPQPSTQPAPANRARAAGFEATATGTRLSVSPLSFDPDGDAVSYSWDFGDGTTSTFAAPSHTYARPGSYTIRLTVADARGATRTVTQSVFVSATATSSVVAATTGAESTSASSSSPTGTARVGSLRRLSPFPVIRIAGRIVGRRTLVRLLTVRSAASTRVTVRCRGRGCPSRRTQRLAPRTNAAVAARRFQGHALAPGASLVVRITRPGHIGRYTRFTFRARRAPLRVDLCSAPGSSRPIPCP